MRIRIIDAFTDRPYAGNPAAVCLLDTPSWPDEHWMQQVAAEMNLAETAFAHPLTDTGHADWALRWFTPTTEVDLCGHATLATAHALHQDAIIHTTIRFATRSGTLTATTSPDGTITLDFPTARLTPIRTPPALASALHTDVAATYHTGDLGDLLVELADEHTVRTLRPDLTALAALAGTDGLPARGVIVTAPADPGYDPGYDFVSRFFGPAVGVPEDPVTGSAHTALAPLWADRTGRTTLTGLQTSHRPGRVRVELHGERVKLTGHAVTVLDGRLTTPDNLQT